MKLPKDGIFMGSLIPKELRNLDKPFIKRKSIKCLTEVHSLISR